MKSLILATICYSSLFADPVKAGFSGWVDAININQPDQKVKKGDVLVEIYSPELHAAQTEYVASLQKGTDEQIAAKAKLQRCGLTEDEILLLSALKQPKWSWPIHATESGTIQKSLVEQGQMIAAGETLFELNPDN